jgi:drug/metabolite transporter (DMT)-like permease
MVPEPEGKCNYHFFGAVDDRRGAASPMRELGMAPRDLLQLFALSAIWGASFILIKFGGESFPPSWIALLRLAFGSAFLLVAMRVRRAPAPPLKTLPMLIVLSLFNNALPFTLIAWGEHSVPSGVASILNATTTLWVLLFSFASVPSTRSLRTAAGVAIGFLGVTIAVLASGDGKTGQGSQLAGVVLVSLGAISYAVGTVLAKSRLKGHDPVGFAAVQLSVATLMMLPTALLGPLPTSVGWVPLLSVAALGTLGTGLAYILYYALMRRISAVQVQAVTYILPVWGLLWGRLDGEPLGWMSAVGVAVVLCGLALLRR